MKSVKLGAVMAAGALMLAGCGGGPESNEAEPTQEANVEPITEYSGPPVQSQNNWPCFNVGEIGAGLMMPWELVVAAGDLPDQPDYIDVLVDAGDDLFDDIEDDTTCGGGTELADFNYEVAKLNIDVTLGEDTDSQYEKLADLGNDLLDISDEQGCEWDYEFVADASELEL